MPTARLPDGREVDTASPEWRAHCLAEWQAQQVVVDRHVSTLQGIRTTADRRAYLERVRQSAGSQIEERVAQGFASWFEAEKKRRQDTARRSTPTG
jgi:antibiotic biosynthesis monooxygenase (ABM) superfamily enzyme